MPKLSPISSLATPTLNTLFLDRDGTIIEDRHYLADPDGVQLLPGVGEALGRLCAAGVRLFLVTNQSGIGRGYFCEDDLNRCQSRLDELLAPYSACLTGMRFCPHEPNIDCECRKPNIGMWHSLAKEHCLDPAHCAMVGDKPADVLFGAQAGFAASFLVLTGKGEQSAGAWQASLPQGIDLAPLAPSSGTSLWLARNLSAVADKVLKG